jgi:hypothetical protein
MTLGMAAGLVILLALLPLATLGPARTAELYRNWTEVLAKPALGHGTDTSRASELTGMSSTDNQSLLAFIHNWMHHDLPRRQRPAQASPFARQMTYAVGVLMLAGIAVVSGFRRKDSRRDAVIIIGLLVGLSFVVSPIVHNFYYFLMVPLVAALLDYSVAESTRRGVKWRMPLVVAVFMAVDILARLPKIGPFLRDCGIPLLSLIWLMFAGAWVLRRDKSRAARAGEEPGSAAELATA